MHFRLVSELYFAQRGLKLYNHINDISEKLYSFAITELEKRVLKSIIFDTGLFIFIKYAADAFGSKYNSYN